MVIYRRKNTLIKWTNYGINNNNFNLAEMVIPLKVTMDRVGHNDHNTTLKIYSHVAEKMSKELVNKLENINIV